MPRHNSRLTALALLATRTLTTLALALAIVLPAAPVLAVPPDAAPPRDTPPMPPLWTYHEKGYDVYAPQLSPDNTRIVFTRKRHMPDGHEAEMYTRQELDDISAPLRNDKRYADPEIMLMELSGSGGAGALSGNAARRIDYGWHPVFSADGQKILYAHQTKATEGRRILAATLNGNEIREHDLKRGSTTTLARPASGFLSQPRYDDRGRPVFFLGAATNGAYGGHIGVGTPDGAGGVKMLLAPQKSHDLYHLVNAFVIRDGKLSVQRQRPLTSGVHRASSYATELLDVANDKVLYRWGIRGSGPSGLTMCPSGLHIYDAGWAKPGTTPALIRSLDYPAGNPSPDCTAVARAKENRLSIQPQDASTPRVWHAPSRYITFSSWSADSTLVVLVLSPGDLAERDAYDEVVVLRVSELPLYQSTFTRRGTR